MQSKLRFLTLLNSIFIRSIEPTLLAEYQLIYLYQVSATNDYIAKDVI